MKKGLLFFACAFLFLFIATVFSGCKSGDDDDDNDSAADDTAADDTSADDTNPVDDTGDDATDDTGDDDTLPPTTPGFARIGGISFTMGSPGTEMGRRWDESPHAVEFTHTYEMMITEVTQAQFSSVMGYNPSHFPLIGSAQTRPVERVSWYDALAYANKFSEARGENTCYVLENIVCSDETTDDADNACKGHGGIESADVSLPVSLYECAGYRLPTEAEWENAARAGTTTATYLGDITNTGCSPVEENVEPAAWYCANSENMTHPVGGKEPNAWGLYDMYGNVMEWTWDWYAIYSDGDQTDPTGPETGTFKAVRGGSFRFSGASRCRSADRVGHTPDFRSYFLGFRLVSSLPFIDEPKSATAPKPVPPTRRRALPTELPFDYTRPDTGTPLTQDEIDTFTQKITSFYKEVDFFRWLSWVSHGMSDTNPDGYPPYKLFQGDFAASKSDGVITFAHNGFDDNLTIPTPKFLGDAVAGYLMSGDETMGRLIKEYSQGITALFQGMLWAEEDQDPEHYLLARNIFPHNNTYTEDGREVVVTYDGAKHYAFDWNAHTIPNPTNPYFDDIWVRNMRSKDDVPHIYRVVPYLQYAAELSPDSDVAEAAATALRHIQGFAADIVDSGYHIRTKDEWGNQYVPTDEHGIVCDLASFVIYEILVANAECTGKLASALVGYADPLDVDCGNGIGWLYEIVATWGHGYNYEIVRFMHIASLMNALMAGADETAYTLMDGLAQRVDYMLYTDPQRTSDAGWNAEAAGVVLASAASGLPMTSAEARLVMEEYSISADNYKLWSNWDLWDASVPDGAVSWRPGEDSPDGRLISLDEMGFILDYCWSPFRNPAGASLINCDIVADPTQW